jgi:hypothetical protein
MISCNLLKLHELGLLRKFRVTDEDVSLFAITHKKACISVLYCLDALLVACFSRFIAHFCDN